MRITPRDLLAVQGEEVVLEVEVERSLAPWVDPGIEGAPVQLEGGGTARTGAGGVARFALGPAPAGSRRYRFRWGDASGEALVVGVDREAPILVTDIDGTLADVSSLAFPFLPNRSVHPLEGAVEALREIARAYAVVYLTARDHIFISKTRAWLELRGFPEGPLYARKQRLWSRSARAHKVDRLGELASRFTNLRWGVGDLRGDVHAYASHAIRPLLVGPAHGRGWRDILEIIGRETRP